MNRIALLAASAAALLLQACNCGVAPATCVEGAACDDSNACTTNDVCTSGVCTGGPVDCHLTETSACRGAASCDPAGAPGNCAVPGAPKNPGMTCGYGQTCSAGECVFDECAARTGSLAFTGLESLHEGGAAWNANAGAPEATKTGHAATWASSCLGPTYYYFASRDYVDSSAEAALHLSGAGPGFEHLKDALAAGGLHLSQVRAKISAMSLGADQQGTDWSYDAGTTTETRYYSGGQLKLTLNGEDLVGGPMPRLKVVLRYHDVTNCTDDAIEAQSEALIPQDQSANSSAPVKAAAAALLQDVGRYGMRINWGGLQPLGQVEFTTNNRQGAYFEAQSGSLEIGPAPLSGCP